MKKALSLLLIIILLCTLLCVGAAAEEGMSLKITPPDRVYYTVGEAIDYTGGTAVYRNGVQAESIALSAQNCTGFSSAAPGNCYVTVTVHDLIGLFRVVILNAGEPILDMTDIFDDHWAFCDMGRTMKAGYFLGRGAGIAAPDAEITRAEMATLIWRAYGTDWRVFSEKSGAVPPFADVCAQDWFYEAVEACRKAGILRGDEAGRCNPNAAITREDAVLMLMRIQYTDAQLNAINVQERLAATPVRDFGSVSAYAQKAMAAALGNLILGDENRRIHPKSPITRAAAAAIFNRLFLADMSWNAPAKPNPGQHAPVVIYLSPSNQYDNPYTGVATTEGAQMYRVGEVVKRILEEQGYAVVMPARELGIRDRCAEANARGDVCAYVAIHSNAMGSANTGSQQGTRAFYNGANQGSKELATEIYNRVAAISPGSEATASQPLKEDYLCLQGGNGTPFVEVGRPTMANVLLEVEFHDYKPYAEWIVNNTEAIGRAIAEGIIAYLK